MTFHIVSKNELFIYYSWKCDVMERLLFLATQIVTKQCISSLETENNALLLYSVSFMT